MNTLDRFRLDGRVAAVTGALGKLGPVWVRALLDAGAKVAAMDLPGSKPSDSYQQLCEGFGDDRLTAVPADVTDRGSLDEALARCINRFGEPSILVNNAGIDQPPSAGDRRHGLCDIPWEIGRGILDVNLLGLFQATQVLARPMMKARRGAIINIGSLYASVSPDARLYDHLPGEEPFLKPPLYGASKAGVTSLSRYLATHLAPFGVRVNALSPGGVLGGQDDEFRRKFNARVPLGRMATPEDLVGPLLFLASDASAYVTGVELLVDGGFTSW